MHSQTHRRYLAYIGISLVVLGTTYFVLPNILSTKYDFAATTAKNQPALVGETNLTPAPAPVAVLDTVAYDKKIVEIANNPAPVVAPIPTSTTSGTVTATSAASTTTSVTPPTPTPVVAPKPTLWPPKTVYPKAGAILPFNRIVAYYGNFYSKKMGALGQYPADEMLKRLMGEVKMWQTADPSTPVIPAIHYIAVTAQGSAGSDGKYRLRMPSDQIDHALTLAHQVNGLLFLDIQVALSNVQTEVPLLEKYLKQPDVHLGLDPEFSMKGGQKPGTVIGTMNAADINYAIKYLSKLVDDNNLPPKILIIHRFTFNMLTGYKDIKPTPEVEVVMDMDGWGFAAKKINTYKSVIYPEPVQFTGFKLFYKNDLLPPSTRMLTPAEILKLTPQPLYIQYQ